MTPITPATPRSSFFRREDRILAVIFWGMTALFFGVMIATWVASERAKPVFLDLETGKPVARKPAL